MDITTETPAAAPAPELSLDEIIASELTAADTSGEAVVQETKAAATETPPADAPKPAEGDAPPAELTPAEPEAPADQITAARARKILEKAEQLQAKFDERERALTEREQAGQRALLTELLKAPKAFLQKHGSNIDDLIDASVAEGKTPEAPAADDRLTQLEQRIAARERAESQAAQDRAIANRKSEIHREVAGSKSYPLLNAAGRAEDVTDYMVEYHAVHGKAISWDKAAAAIERDLRLTGEKVAEKLGWTKPAAAAPAAAAKDRPGTVSIGGAQSTGASGTEAEPEDPEKLMKYLVAQAGL